MQLNAYSTDCVYGNPNLDDVGVESGTLMWENCSPHARTLNLLILP
jgi:hypothetical protein